jgi:hypothetical protein
MPSQIYTLTNPGPHKSRTSKIHTLTNPHTQKSRSSRINTLTNSHHHKSKTSIFNALKNSRPHKCTSTQIQTLTNAYHKSTPSQIHKLTNYKIKAQLTLFSHLRSCFRRVSLHCDFQPDFCIYLSSVSTFSCPAIFIRLTKRQSSASFSCCMHILGLIIFFKLTLYSC